MMDLSYFKNPAKFQSKCLAQRLVSGPFIYGIHTEEGREERGHKILTNFADACQCFLGTFHEVNNKRTILSKKYFTYSQCEVFLKVITHTNMMQFSKISKQVPSPEPEGSFICDIHKEGRGGGEKGNKILANFADMLQMVFGRWTFSFMMETLYGPLLWMKFNCLKATEPL